MFNIFNKKKKVRIKSEPQGFRAYFELFSETLIYVFFVMTFLLQSFVIPTGSMQDNLLIGDHLLVDKFSYSQSIGYPDALIFPQLKIEREMIVTFKSPIEPEKEYVKRVIGLPGERIRVEENVVYINDVPLKESYTFFKGAGYGQHRGENMAEREIPQDSFFCMGDNRWNSSDSRFWGPVHRNLIVGKPWLVYWSYESDRDQYLSTNLFSKIKDLAMTAVTFFSKTRWERTIMLIR
jgi:signal peptidase I